MAPQVADILIKLGISGDKDLDRLRNVFKDLTSTVDITDAAISKAKNAVEAYVKTANNSEAVIKGQVTAFERLKSQADVTGTAYQTLDNDIKALKQQLIGASTNLLIQRDALVKNANSTKASASEVSKYVAQLKRLQEQTRASSQAFNTIESDIASLTLKMQQLRKEEMADFGKNAVNATKNALSGLQTGVQQSISLFTRLGEQSKTAFGQVARTVEGITALSIGGVVAGGGAGALGVLSSMLQGGGSSLANIKATLGNLPGIGGQAQQLISPDAIARLTDAASKISALQAKVVGLDQAMGAVTGAFASLGPTAGAAAIAASTGIAIIYDRLRNEADKTRIDLEQSFKGIDDEVQSLLRSLTKLRDQIQSLSMTKINELLGTARQRFAAAPAGTPLSRSMASQIAGLESIQQQEAAAQADVLEEYRQRVRGTSTAITELNQRLTYLKSSISQVDTSTTEGRAKFAQLSNESIQLSEQIRKLGDSYQHVAAMAHAAADAQAAAANRPTSRNYLSAGIVSAERQAMAELGTRVRAGIEGTPLLLPAAGQTSAPGTGLPISGENVRFGGRASVTYRTPGAEGVVPRYGVQPGGGVERFFGRGEPGWASGTVPIGPAMTPEQDIKNRTRVITETGQAYDALGKSVERARRPLRDIYVDIDKTTKASNGSINSLDAQIAVWTELRNAVGKTAPAFDTATKKLEQLTTQRERLGAGRRRRLSGTQLAQGFGAAITGGIFGGPEGLIGGLGGLAIRGVEGAFAGAAIGAQVGMFRQQLATVTDYSARIDKLQIALRGIVGSQDAYNTVLASAARVTKDLNIPQETVIQGMTRLSAAVLGAGGNVSDSTFAFGAITKAIKATGGSAEQADGAILALTQVFSKGKVSAEELNQIAERLPGTFTLFAKATGRTGPELLKALQDGKVGLNDLMKFLSSIDTQYGQTALNVAKSTQDAGARLTVAVQAMQLDVGRSLQPLGAALQSTFADFITTTAPAFIGAIKGISSAVTFIVTDSVGKEFAKLSLYLGAATAAALLLEPAMLGIAAAMAFAKQQVIALTLAMARNPLTLLAIAASAAALRLAEAVLQQKGLNDEVARTLTLAGKQSPSSVAAQINATQEALRAAKEKAKPDVQTDYLGLNAAGAILEVERLEKKLVKLRQIYKARIEFETIFKGLDPRAGVPEGYKIVNGRLAYLSPGQGYVDAETGKPVRGSSFASQTDGLSTEDKNRLGQSYLQAFDQRAEALAKARQDREEAIAAIRKKAAEDLLTLERTLGDERRRIEYDIQNLRRKATATGEDISLLRRLQSGEDPRRIEAERQILDIYRKSEEDRAQAEQQFNEEELTQARTIADYQKNIAKEIAAANETYNKRIGEAQKEFAKASAKIIEEGSGKAAKRLEIGARIVALYMQRGALNTRLVSAGVPAVADPGIGVRPGTYPAQGLLRTLGIGDNPEFAAPIERIDDIDKQLRELNKRLQSRGPAGAGATASRFMAALGGRGAGASIASVSSDTYPLLAGLHIGDPVPFVQPTPIQVTPAAGATSDARQQRLGQQNININETERKDIIEFFSKSTEASQNLKQNLEDQNYELSVQAKYLRSDINPELQRQLVNAEVVYKSSLDTAERNRDAALAQHKNLELVTQEYNNQVTSAMDLYAANIDLINQGEVLRTQLEDMSKEFGPRFSASLKQYYESVTDLGTQIGGVVQSTFQGLEDQLTNFVTTGKVNFADLANSILADMARIAIRQAIIAPLLRGIGSMFPGLGLKFNANGAAYAANGIVPFAMGGTFQRGITPYAMGGIVSRPTFFAYANGGVPGTGLMGEAGPEAVVPLRRLPSGKLGVGSTGGGAVTVNVSVDATGSQVQGDAGKSNQLGRAVAAAVQAELIKQKRPGGLLVS